MNYKEVIENLWISTYGYNFFESLYDKKTKERFLKENFSISEKKLYGYLDNTVIFSWTVFVAYGSLSYILRGFVDGWTILFGFPPILSSIIKQNYRKIKLNKHGFPRKKILKNKVIAALFNITTLLFVIYGIIKLFSFFSNLF